jgi:hypothetical protein
MNFLEEIKELTSKAKTSERMTARRAAAREKVDAMIVIIDHEIREAAQAGKTWFSIEHGEMFDHFHVAGNYEFDDAQWGMDQVAMRYHHQGFSVSADERLMISWGDGEN